MRSIVTGGAGFIGSHLVELLLGEGHQVTVIDNFSTGKLSNLKKVEEHPLLTILKDDISVEIPDYKLGGKTDWFFHLAGLADIVPSIEKPLAYHQANVTGTIQALELARKLKVSKFVYAASSSCYGLASTLPTPESAPLQPMYPYALTKQLGEEYVLHWHKTYKLPAVSLRLFNVYGPRSRTSGSYGAVFGTFLAQKLNGRPLTIVGDGSQSRDFVFVTDVVRAFFLAAKNARSGEILNVGTGSSQSINHLAELIGGEIVHVPERPGEPQSTCADITKIENELGWKAEMSFELGVQHLLNDIEIWRDAPIWDPSSIKAATASWFHFLKSKEESVLVLEKFNV
jgi:UDP-glucose 4-epimerase